MTNEISFLSTMAEVTTIWAIIYELPNFISQMNAENSSSIASSALEIIPDIRTAVSLLRKGYYEKDEIKIEAIKQLTSLYEKLKIYLTLLCNNSNIKGYLDETNKKLKLLCKNNDDLYNERMVDYFNLTLGLEFRDTLKVTNHLTPDLDKLQETLQQIFENPINQNKHWIKNGIIVFILSLVVYTIQMKLA